MQILKMCIRVAKYIHSLGKTQGCVYKLPFNNYFIEFNSN